MNTSKENKLDYLGHKTWYVVHSGGNNTPLFVLHGGPGFPHNLQNNHAQLAKDGYDVVLYDQLGCGLSDTVEDTSLFQISTYVEELETLRKHLGHNKINVIGQSWGGSLAIEYALEYPANVNKLVLHSPLIDTKLWVEEADRLKDELPDDKGARMRALEESGDTDGDEYNTLSQLFNEHFVMRVTPKPQDVIDAEEAANLLMFNTMWGPSEAHATGILKDWSAINRLDQIKSQTLLISGKYDEATPKQMKIVAEKIPNITWELFENSSHSANLEEPEKFLQVVSDFLK